jgi:hypothetical protein
VLANRRPQTTQHAAPLGERRVRARNERRALTFEEPRQAVAAAHLAGGAIIWICHREWIW